MSINTCITATQVHLSPGYNICLRTEQVRAVFSKTQLTTLLFVPEISQITPILSMKQLIRYQRIWLHCFVTHGIWF